MIPLNIFSYCQPNIGPNIIIIFMLHTFTINIKSHIFLNSGLVCHLCILSLFLLAKKLRHFSFKSFSFLNFLNFLLSTFVFICIQDVLDSVSLHSCTLLWIWFCSICLCYDFIFCSNIAFSISIAIIFSQFVPTY